MFVKAYPRPYHPASIVADMNTQASPTRAYRPDIAYYKAAGGHYSIPAHPYPLADA